MIFSQGGLSTLTQNGVLYLPKTFFMIASLIAFGVLLLAYWRHHDQMREAMWILPGIVMWLSYRSLFSYWVCWAFPMVMATVNQPAARQEAESHPVSWKPTLSIAIGAAVLMVVMGAVIATPSGRIQMRLQLPMLASQGGIDKLVVDVTNLGRHELTPRFSIQSQTTYGNPLPWYVEQGPFVLPAGATATYTIASSRADRTFFGIEPVQLVATDAGGDYSLRGVLTIEPDPAFMWPDLILNADYRTWNEAQHMPAYWQPFNLDFGFLGHSRRTSGHPTPPRAAPRICRGRAIFPRASSTPALLLASGSTRRARRLECVRVGDLRWHKPALAAIWTGAVQRPAGGRRAPHPTHCPGAALDLPGDRPAGGLC